MEISMGNVSQCAPDVPVLAILRIIISNNKSRTTVWENYSGSFFRIIRGKSCLEWSFGIMIHNNSQEFPGIISINHFKWSFRIFFQNNSSESFLEMIILRYYFWWIIPNDHLKWSFGRIISNNSQELLRDVWNDTLKEYFQMILKSY